MEVLKQLNQRLDPCATAPSAVGTGKKPHSKLPVYGLEMYTCLEGTRHQMLADHTNMAV